MSTTVTMYGIRNCDTVRKARAWLDERKVRYTFHDVKVDGLERAQLEAWCRAHGWQVLLNRAGTTFRNLPAAVKHDLSEPAAIALILEHPSIMKRPVLDAGGRSVVGFTPDRYEAFLA